MKKIDQTSVKSMSHLPAYPHPQPHSPSRPQIHTHTFQVEEINIGILLKAYAFSHMMLEKLGSKSTHSLYTSIKSEGKEMTKLK